METRVRGSWPTERIFTLVGAMILLLGQIAPAPSSASEPVAEMSPLVADHTMHELMDLVGSEVPEFGGVFSAGPSSLGILVVGQSSSAASEAQVSLAKWLSPFYASKDIVVLPATYSFHQLKVWHDAATAKIFSIEGVTTNFIEDKMNRLHVGVRSLSDDEGTVRESLEELGIPREAVAVSEIQPFVSKSSLRLHPHAPRVGGLQIQSLTPAGQVCTLGATSVWQGFTGFMTAAHCGHLGVQDGFGYGNHTVNHPIGWEVHDSPTFTGSPCPSGWACRWADVEFDRNLAAAPVDLGRIAKPSVPPPGTAWAGAKWRVVGELLTLPDDFVTKVGSQTGSTGALVIDDCANVPRQITMMLCQALVEWIPVPMGGDSGSPVFMRVGGTQSDVIFMGIFWGSEEGGTVSAYSTILGIEKSAELDSVNTCAPPFSC